MKKRLAVLLCLALLSAAPAALAQTVPCPEAHLVFTAPDDWNILPLPKNPDPDLVLLMEGKSVSLSVYVTEAGGLMPESFQIFTGNDTETFTAVLSGVRMDCVSGRDQQGDYRIYTWPDRKNQVQFYFVLTGRADSARRAVESVMNSIEFDSP